MRKLVMGCAVAGLIALSPKSEARVPVSVGPFPLAVVDRQQVGVASWYGPAFQGKTTASGETYNLNGLTAAHPTLPFGTTIRVTNLNNHKNMLLRINDRGPNFGNRMVDVSLAAARRLGFVRSGTTLVRVDVVSYPKWFLAQAAVQTNY